MTSIVRGICSLEEPSPHIQAFLTTLLSDGNFFRDGYLYPLEKERLQFDRYGTFLRWTFIFAALVMYYSVIYSLGATRDVVMLTDEKALVEKLTRTRGGDGGDDLMRNILQLDGKSYDITRAKMIIKNYLLTR